MNDEDPINQESSPPDENDQKSQTLGVCANGHELGPGEKFCGKCGAPGVDDVPQVVSESPATSSTAEVAPRSSRLSRRVLIVGLVTLILVAGITTGIVASTDSASSAPWSNQQLKSHLTFAVTAVSAAMAREESGAAASGGSNTFSINDLFSDTVSLGEAQAAVLDLTGTILPNLENRMLELINHSQGVTSAAFEQVRLAAVALAKEANVLEEESTTNAGSDCTKSLPFECAHGFALINHLSSSTVSAFVADENALLNAEVNAGKHVGASFAFTTTTTSTTPTTTATTPVSSPCSSGAWPPAPSGLVSALTPLLTQGIYTMNEVAITACLDPTDPTWAKYGIGSAPGFSVQGAGGIAHEVGGVWMNVDGPGSAYIGCNTTEVPAEVRAAFNITSCPSATTVPTTTPPTNSVPLQTSTGGEFLSPSNNISCELDYGRTGVADAAYCQTFSPPQSVTMSTDGSFKTCTGSDCVGNPGIDTPTLAYGQATGIGPFTCVSAASGITCTVSSRGFQISSSGITAVGAS